MPASPIDHSTQEFSQWIQASRGGDLAARGRLLEACRRYLEVVAYKELPADLQAKISGSDLVQHTFLKAHQEFAGFHGNHKKQLLAWLRRILLNRLANVRRQVQAHPDVPLDEPDNVALQNGLVDPGKSPSSQARGRERDEALHRALEQLSEPYRRVIHLRNYERCSWEEVGQRLNRSAEAARRLFGRAVEHLQEILEPPHGS